MTLTDIFQTLGVNQQFGWLSLRSLSRQVCLYFEGDLVALATSPEEKIKYIPSKLYHAGKLTEEAYQSLMASENPIGMLQQENKEEFGNMVNTICYEEICNTFNWEQGYFEFVPYNHPDAFSDMAPVGKMFEVRGVLMEVVQRQQEFQEIAQFLRLPEEIIVQNDVLDMECSKDDPMGNIWHLAHYRSIREIALFSYFSEFDTYRVLSSFITEGKLRLITDEELHVQAAEHEKNENWMKAIEYYQVALKRNPMDIASADALSQCYTKTGQQEQLIAFYRGMGELFINSHNFKERTYGAGYIKKFSDLTPESPEGIEAKIALFYAVVGQQIDSKAIEYNTILEGKKLFQALRSRKDDERARYILQTLLQITPHDKTLQSQLINVCLDLKDIPSAIAQYESMIKIYERDKNWEELISTYQKIIKLNPSRKDIQKKLELVESKTRKGPKIVVRAILILLCVGLGVGGWFGYEKYVKKSPPENGKTNENPIPEPVDNQAKIRQMLEEKARKDLQLAIEEKKQGKLEKSRQTLKDILSTSIPENIKKSVEEELESVEQLLAEYKNNVQEFQKSYANAENLKKEKRFTHAISIYLALWKDDQYRNMPGHSQIRLPISFRVSPPGASVIIDGKEIDTLGDEEKIIECHPEFREITVQRKGYAPKKYYNSFLKSGDRVITDAQGNQVYPLHEGNIVLNLEKVILFKIDIAEQGRSTIDADPFFANGVLYIASRDDHLYGFKGLSTHPERSWIQKMGQFSSFSAAPVCHDNVIYIGGNNACFYAFNVSLKKLWGRYNLPQGTMIPSSADVSESYGLVIFSSTKFGVEKEGQLYAFPLLKSQNRGWGAKWVFSTPQKMETAPVIEGGRVLIGNNDGNLYCLNVANGGVLWKSSLGRAVHCTPVVENNIVYIVGSGYARALRIDNGKELWKTPVKGDAVKPLVKNGALYFGTTGKKIYAISLEGQILWEYEGIAPFKAPPALGNDLLYLGSQKGSVKGKEERIALLYAIHSKTGEVAWEYEIAKDILSSPIVLGNVVVQAADKLYVFLDS